MNIVSKIERKFGKYSIRNLTLYLIIGYGIGYLLLTFQPKILFMLTLDPAAVMHGQVWRLVTWIITPPTFGVDIFTFIMLFFYYSIGTLLERTLGTFLYNLYMFSSMLFTMAGMMIAHILCVYVFHYNYYSVINYASTYYILLSIFLAIAACYPDMSVLYAMIIPIKMKYLSILYVLIIVYYFIHETFMGRVNIAMSLVSFVIFYLSTKNIRRFSPKQMKRRRNYNKQVRNAKSQNVGHRCVVCGRTDKEYPDLQFRYCSKCTGNKEYCQDHLFTHVHN
ncbi:MAG: hypothetical protein PUG00_05105 [Clostridiales bacterium]|nr:hypothetical protein [Clostridiales bacterium]